MRQAQSQGAFRLTPLFALLGFALVPAPAQAAGGLVLFPDPLLLVVMITAFTLLIAPMNALVFKPIFRVLDERKKRIDGARVRAAQLQGEADEVLQRYRNLVQEVREETDGDRRRSLEEARNESAVAAADARSEAEAVIERGRSELDGWLAGARADLRSSAGPLAQAAAERVLGRELN